MSRFDRLSWEDTANVVTQLLFCIKQNEQDGYSVYKNFVLTVPELSCPKCREKSPESEQDYLCINEGGSIIEELKKIIKEWFTCPDPACNTQLEGSNIKFPRFLVIRCNKERKTDLTMKLFSTYFLRSYAISNGIHATAFARYGEDWYYFNDKMKPEKQKNPRTNNNVLIAIYEKIK